MMKVIFQHGNLKRAFVCTCLSFILLSMSLLFADFSPADKDDQIKVQHAADGSILTKHSGTDARGPRFAPDQIVFKLSKSANAAQEKSRSQSRLSQIASAHRLNKVISPMSRLSIDSGHPIYTAQLAEGMSPLEMAEQLQTDPDVEWAEPLYYREVMTTTPNDPYFFDTFLDSYEIGVRRAWDTTTGSQDVIVAIIDTGVDWTHEDLQNNIWTNPGEIANDGVDNDENGYIDDIRGWDFVTVGSGSVWPGEEYGPEDNDPMDFESHGTHVAGIIGAQGNNGIGVAGVCWNVSLMPLRAGYKNSQGNGVLSITAIANALRYAADNGADIVNMSFGSGDLSHTEREAIDYCHQAGVLLVSSAGNSSVDAPSYPAAFENVIAVSAVSGLRRTSYSNYGSWVDIAALGSTESTVPGNEYTYKSGTSMASPLVAGAAALIKSAHPTLTADQIRQRLLSTTGNINPSNKGINNLLGSGIIHVDDALNLTTDSPRIGLFELVETEISGNMDGIPDPGETFQLQPVIKNFGYGQQHVSAELSTSDPYVTVHSGSVFFGSIDPDHIKRAIDPVDITIHPGTPRDHTVAINAVVSINGVPLSQTDQLYFEVNPTLRSVQYAEKANTSGHSDPTIINLATGKSFVLYSTSGFNNPNNIYVQSGSKQTGWDYPQPLFVDSGINTAHDYVAVSDANDVIHVVGECNVGSWDSELFYRSYDPNTNSWGDIVQLTTDAEIFSPVFVVTTMACAVDPNSRMFHMVWIDDQSGYPDFYHLSYDGQTWSDSSIIYTPSFESDEYDGEIVALLFDHSGVGHLILDDNNNKQLLSMTYRNQTWSDPNFVVTYSSRYQDASAVIDSDDTLHITYNEYYSPDNVLQYIYQEPNEPWSAPQQVASDVNRGSAIVIMPSGGINIFYEADDPDYKNTIHYEIFVAEQNGHFWENRMLTKTKTGLETLNDYYYSVDRQGDIQIVSAYSGTPDEYNGLNAFVMSYSSSNEVLLPSEPQITDDGMTTADRTRLSANWSLSHHSGIDNYEYAIGTYPGGYDLQYWSNAGLLTRIEKNVQDTPLQVRQEYYVSVKAMNSSDYTAIGVSDGIVYQPGDQDGDGFVGVADLDAWFINWLGDCGQCSGYDFNLDEVVSLKDFSIFADNWLWEHDSLGQ